MADRAERAIWRNALLSTVIYSCLIYELVLVMKIFGIYTVDRWDPAIVVSYVSLLHLAQLPSLFLLKSGAPSRTLPPAQLLLHPQPEHWHLTTVEVG